MQKAKKLIEVALPIKEISAESVRDKSIRHGHISTLNQLENIVHYMYRSSIGEESTLSPQNSRPS